MKDSSASPRVIAFFDVDNTLIRGASLYYFGRSAFQRRMIGLSDILVFGWQQARFSAVGENKRHLAQVKDRALELLSGRNVQEVQKLAKEVTEKTISKRLWKLTIDLVNDHLAQGHEVWLTTAAPTVLAAEIGEYIGVTGTIGTNLESIDGVYTGKVDGHVLHGAWKAEGVERLAKERGFDLADAYAYSDSRNDIPLLNLVGNPVAVNPDKALQRYAEARGWRTIRRKESRAAQR